MLKIMSRFPETIREFRRKDVIRNATCKRFQNLLQKPPNRSHGKKITLCRPMRIFTIGLRSAIKILKKGFNKKYLILAPECICLLSECICFS